MSYDTLRPYLSRILAPMITFILAYLARKFGLVFDENTGKVITEGAVLMIIPVLLAVNGIAHKTLDKWFNPGDAASSHLAGQEKIEVNRMKQ